MSINYTVSSISRLYYNALYLLVCRQDITAMGCGASVAPCPQSASEKKPISTPVRNILSQPQINKYEDDDDDDSDAGDFNEPKPTIQRQAFGHIARLGDLYDATIDKFCGVSLFREPLTSDSPAISKTDNPNTISMVITATNLEDKFRELEVAGDLQLSIIAGMCQLGAKYFSQETTSFRSVKETRLCHVKAATEHLEINDQVKRNISVNAINRSGATHVVIDIEWGAKCVATGWKETHRVEKSRKALGRTSATSIIGSIFKKKTETVEQTDTKVDIVGDILPDELPQTLESAERMMRDLPQIMKNSNDGKGKPIAYTMLPLSNITSRKKSESFKTFTAVDETRIKKVVRLFDSITKFRQKVNEWNEKLKDCNDQVEPNEFEKARRLADDFDDHQDSLKRELSQLLVNIRSAKEDVKRLDDFCTKHEQTAKNKFHECDECYHAIQARLTAEQQNKNNQSCVIQ